MVVAVKKITGQKHLVDTKGSDLSVRSGPGTNNAKIDSLKKGTEVEVVKTTGAWKQLKRGGWVHGDYLAQPVKITIRHDSSRSEKNRRLLATFNPMPRRLSYPILTPVFQAFPFSNP